MAKRPMRAPDPDQVRTILEETGQRLVLPRFRALARHEILEKKPGDVVTIADREAEADLTRRLSGLLPGSVVVGEEAAHADPDILAHLANEDLVWIVDPVDGTANFVKGDPRFCMMVALAHKGRLVQSYIHDPVEARTAVAEEGAGARFGGERLSLGDAAPDFAAMTGQVNFNIYPTEIRAEKKARLRPLFGRLDSIGSAGQDFLAQARGERHFALYRRLWPWDHAPGVLLLREAGGKADRLDGAPYRISDRVRGLLSAPDPDRWAELAHHLGRDIRPD